MGVQPAMIPVAAGDLPPERQRKARENAAGLRRAIERARSYYLVTPGIGATRVLRPGGIVYFPPGRYLIARPSTPPPSDVPGDVRSDIVVPPEVTLWFAPGAVLVPLGDEEPRLDGLPPAERRKVYIEIQGDIIAGIQQIFDVAVNAEDTAHTAGEIILTSLRVRELYPEWWGASSLPADLSPASPVMWRTTMAVQAAFDAAYNHRCVRRRRPDGAFSDDPTVFVRRLPSIPVVLKGVYEVNGALFIGIPNSELDATGAVPFDTPVPLGGFELRGENAIYAPSIRAGKAIVRPSAADPLQPISRENSGTLLTIRGPVTFSIRNVNFDGNYRAATCVAVEPVVGDWGYSSFEGCNFTACRHTVVRLDAERRRRSGSALSKRDFWNITFSRCHFFVIDVGVAEPSVHRDGGPEPTTDAITTDIRVTLAPYSFEEGTVVAVDVDLKENEGLEFRNCFFLHVASPAIRAVSGRFALNETLFHVIRPPVPFGEIDATHGHNDSRHGTDIYIEARDAGGASTAPERLVPATFTALECETHSVQFLATSDTPRHFNTNGQTRSATVLMNVVSSHEVVPEHLRAADSETYDNWYVNHGAEPPAIYWSHPGTMGCALIMVGCAFTGPRDKGGMSAVSRSNLDWPNKNRRVVYLGGEPAGYVYDLASNLIGAAPDDMMAWNDVIFNSSTSAISGGLTLALRPNPRLIRRFSPLRFDEFL